MTPTFTPTRDRDAYAVIRGFLYQIDRTVDRWLDLRNGECLELERGEDIDLINQYLSTNDQPAQLRLLEQVKHREANITLRSEIAREALANFHDHRNSNRSLDLFFCLMTNAAVGCEQLNPFPNAMPGIDLWQRIREDHYPVDEIHGALAAIRDFLGTLSKPESIADLSWQGFQAFLRDAPIDDLHDFVRRFEWSTVNPDAEQLPINNRQKIQALGLCRDDIEATDLYHRLFVFVARRLSASGLKRLTAKDLLGVVSEPTLATVDREFLKRLQILLATQVARIDDIDMRITEFGQQLSNLIVRSQVSAQIIPTVAPTDLSVPPLVSRCAGRSATVTSFADKLATHAWLAMHGGPDVGKSQLAILIANRFEGIRFWLRFHTEQSNHDALALLERGLSLAAGLRQLPDGPRRYQAALTKFGTGAVIVLDDVPRIAGDSPFSRALISLGLNSHIAHVKILSTSHHLLPLRLIQTLGDDRIVEAPAPMFDELEVREMFRAFGAAEHLLRKSLLTLICGITGGHPLLLSAAIEYLRDRNWTFQEEELKALFQGDHTQRVVPEVLARLTKTLGIAQRDLLYRLTLPIGSFTRAEVLALAAVEPSIERPQERFNDILGAWIQREAATRFSVSPLVKHLGSTELCDKTRRICYRKLGELITSYGRMDGRQATQAILYNVSANEVGRAMALYFLLLNSAIGVKKTWYVVNAIDLWRETRLPERIDVGMQLTIRGHQLAAFTEFGMNTDYVVRDIDRLLATASEQDGWGIIVLVFRSAVHYAGRDIDRVLGYTKRACELGVILGPGGMEIEFDFLPEVLWWLITHLDTPSRLFRWFSAVESLPDDRRQRFWASDLARQGTLLIPNRLYLAECEKSPLQRDVETALSALSNLLDRAERLSHALLEASITRVMLYFRSDLKQIDALPEIGRRTLNRWPDDNDVQFLVQGAWGRQYTSNGQHDLARPLLEQALKNEPVGFDHERLLALLAANQSFGVVNSATALQYAERARDLAQESEDIPELQSAKAFGEHAIAVYLETGDRAGAIKAYSSCAVGMKRLLAIGNKDGLWKDSVIRFGHTAGFLAQLARHGKPPEQIADGDPWMAPDRGLLMRFHEDSIGLYTEQKDASLMLLMSEYALAARDEKDRRYWLSQAMESARKFGAQFVLAAAGHGHIADLLASDLYEDALEQGVFSGRGLVVHRFLYADKPPSLNGKGIDIAADFKKLSKEKRRQGDVFAVIAGVIPAALRIVDVAIDNPAAAAAAGQRLSPLCRQLSGEDHGYQELWQGAAELFSLASLERANHQTIVKKTHEFDGNEFPTLRILGYLLASWHMPPEDAVNSQLACIQHLLAWYPRPEPVYLQIVVPYFERYWLNAAKNKQFYFQTPGLTAEAIRNSTTVPEDERVRSILLAAASGLRIRGLQPALRWLRSDGTTGSDRNVASIVPPGNGQPGV